AAPRMRRNFFGVLPVAHPTEPHAATVGFRHLAPGDAGIEIRAVISPERGRVVRLEARAVELADEILAARAARRAAGIDVHNQHPLRPAAFDGEREKIGTLPQPAPRAHATELADVFPLLEI